MYEYEYLVFDIQAHSASQIEDTLNQYAQIGYRVIQMIDELIIVERRTGLSDHEAFGSRQDTVDAVEQQQKLRDEWKEEINQ